MKKVVPGDGEEDMVVEESSGRKIGPTAVGELVEIGGDMANGAMAKSTERL